MKDRFPAYSRRLKQWVEFEFVEPKKIKIVDINPKYSKKRK